MPTDPDSSPRQILAALQAGRAAALNAIIQRWQRPLLAFAYRYTQNPTESNELVADAFSRLYLHRLRLRPDTNIASWLFATLSNLCRNHRRWQNRHPTVSLDAEAAGGAPGTAPGDLVSPTGTPAAALAREEKLDAVRTAVEALPHDLKVTVLLYHYERFSYREIAEITDCSERGVETRLYRAKQLLKQSLADWLNEPATRS